MERRTRRRFLRAVRLGGTVGLGGCLSNSGQASGSPPFADRIVFESTGSAPLSNPWFYKERFTDGGPIEGLERPMWVCVFADQPDYEETPAEDQPYRNFEIADGSVEPKVGTEPTNDAYIALKRRDGGDAATLVFVARTAAYSSRILFDDEVLFRTEETEPGATFELPP